MKNTSRIWEQLDEQTQKELQEFFPEMRPPRRVDRPHHKVRVEDDSSHKLTVTIHALERMEERWGITNQELARLRKLGPQDKLDNDFDRSRYRAIKGLDDNEVRRFQECVGLTDEEIARVIQGEINDAVIGGRHGDNVPLELANYDVSRWRSKKGMWFCWTEDKTRGYVCIDDKHDGVVVLTTLIGDIGERARSKLLTRRK